MTSRLQFSIRFLLVATAVVAGALAALCAGPSWKASAALCGLSVAFPTATVIPSKHSTGRLHAFLIGTSIVFGLGPILAVTVAGMTAVIFFEQFRNGTVTMMEEYDWYSPPFKWCLSAIWCAAPINGVLAALVHWLFAPRRNPPA